MPVARFVLGRGVVVRPDQAPPTGWQDLQRIRVGAEEVGSPGPVAEHLHAAWLARRPVVVELSRDAATLRESEQFDGPVYDLDAGFEFGRERLQFLVWANNYDLRSGEPIWWHARKAARRISGTRVGGPADLLGRGERPYFLDGGPPDPPELATGTSVVHRFSTEAGELLPACHKRPTADLAPDQLRAVTHPAGGARVIAPAGSGKTRVLSERLRHLVADRRAHPSTVTAVAFNKRAAEEMRNRLPALVTAHGPQIRTLNSLGLWVCNELGEDGRVQVLEEAGARQLVEAVFPVRRQVNTDTVAPYLDALSAVRLGLSPPQDVELALPDAAGLAEAFETYRLELRRRHVVDFDEQIYRAIEILLRDPAARSRAQASCRRMLVDEFQDLTPAHMLLIRLLCAPGYDCFGVGDDDQVIYGYSGADPRFLLDFSRYFPGAGSHVLGVNYRCPPAVVAAAAHLLSYNTRRVDKTPRAAPTRQDPPPVPAGLLAGMGAVAHIAAAGEELAHVAVDIASGWLEEGVQPDRVAILARVSSALLPVHVACIEAGVPVSSTLGPAVLRRTGVRTALAYLRIARQPDLIRRDDVLDTIHRPSRKVSRSVAEMLTKRPSCSVAEIRRLAHRLSGGDAPKLKAYADDLEKVAAGRTSADSLRTVRLDLGLGTQMDVLDESRGEADRSTHADDLLAIEAVAAMHPELDGFEEWLTDLLTRPAAPGPAVLLSTVHKIKGKEWPRVIVFGASQGLFPHRLGDDEEEERRVFHVALTRALDQVVVLYDRATPSPFIAELQGSRPHTPLRSRRAPVSQARVHKVPGRLGPSGVAGKRSKAPKPARPDEVVTATVGLELEVGGQRGSVLELHADGVLVHIGSVRVDVAYGTRMRVGGRLLVLLAPEAASEVSSAVDGVEQALREWRAALAKAQKVPAYVILNDADLRKVAERAPTSLVELRHCPGMGPLRLERYGDDILGVVDQARRTRTMHGSGPRPKRSRSARETR